MLSRPCAQSLRQEAWIECSLPCPSLSGGLLGSEAGFPTAVLVACEPEWRPLTFLYRTPFGPTLPTELKEMHPVLFPLGKHWVYICYLVCSHSSFLRGGRGYLLYQGENLGRYRLNNLPMSHRGQGSNTRCLALKPILGPHCIWPLSTEEGGLG